MVFIFNTPLYRIWIFIWKYGGNKNFNSKPLDHKASILCHAEYLTGFKRNETLAHAEYSTNFNCDKSKKLSVQEIDLVTYPRNRWMIMQHYRSSLRLFSRIYFITPRRLSSWNHSHSIPDVAKPVHEIVQELLLIAQLPEPHCSTFLQSQDLSESGGYEISNWCIWNIQIHL
jgi:hypothetical protein